MTTFTPEELKQLVDLMNDKILSLQSFELSEGRSIEESAMRDRYPDRMALMDKLLYQYQQSLLSGSQTETSP